MRKIPNTFGIDVTAARFLEYGSEDELRELIAAGQVVAPWLHIGGGSNLLFIKDYEGTVLHSRTQRRRKMVDYSRRHSAGDQILSA